MQIKLLWMIRYKRHQLFNNSLLGKQRLRLGVEKKVYGRRYYSQI